MKNDLTGTNAEHSEMENEQIFDIRQRTFSFAVRIVRLCRYLERNVDVDRSLLRQLSRSATSVGANLEEAAAGQSKADFIHKNAVSLKEARESNYWLRLIIETTEFDAGTAIGIGEIEKESIEIAKIIGRIIINAKKP